MKRGTVTVGSSDMILFELNCLCWRTGGDNYDKIVIVELYVLLCYAFFICFVDRASLYNLVNKATLVHNLFLVYLSISTSLYNLVNNIYSFLFLVYLSASTYRN